MKQKDACSKNYKIGKPLGRLTKVKEKTQIHKSNIKNKTKDIKTDPVTI